MQPMPNYFAAPGLSNSAIGDLLVSPLRFWHLQVNPNRPVEEPTPAMQFGSALHCAVLEPTVFESRYCQRLDAEEIEGCLVTMDDLRSWLRDQGKTPKGTRKAEVIAQVQAVDPSVPIFDVLKESHDAANEGKVQFKSDDWFRIGGAAQALREEPKLQEILTDPRGEAEKQFTVETPAWAQSGIPAGILLKAKMDWVTPTCTLDLKTFSATRDKPIDKVVTEAIWFNGLYRQAYFYSMVRALASGNTDPSGAQKAPPFVIAFVESEEPHEVRIRELRPKESGEVNLLWHKARFEVNGAIALYAEYREKFGERPWRYARDRELLLDEEFPALMYTHG